MKSQILPPRAARRYLSFAVVAAIAALSGSETAAFERYSSCKTCHGDFGGSVSPKEPATIFPSDSKHTMHRSNNYMNTDCDLCHRDDDGNPRNPYTGSSNGAGEVAGVGCTGCHLAQGLRAHHIANGLDCTAVCHDPPNPSREDVIPPYYGTAYTKANNPCNDVFQSNTNENWSVGDFEGLDNDGDNLYDLADFDCGPDYRIVSVVPEGDSVRVSWETVGGRKDVIQASATVDGGYSDVSGTITNLGVGVRTTNYLEMGGGIDAAKFYRVRSEP